ILSKLEPGAGIPPHKHEDLEQTFVLEGSLLDGEGECTAGNFVIRAKGSQHAPVAPRGCTMLVFFLNPPTPLLRPLSLPPGAPPPQGARPAATRAMAKSELNVRAILAGQAPKAAPVTVKGWVRTRRDSKAGISFVHLSDGSSFHPVQVVAPNTLPNYADEILKLTTACAIEATGTVVPSPAKGQPFELQASDIRVIGWVDDPDTYPIQPKPHTMEFLREVAHLRPRTNVIAAATRVRHTLAQAIHRYFDEHGFFWVNTPIITASDAEGAGALFRVSTLDLANLPHTPQGKVDFAQDFFGREA